MPARWYKERAKMIEKSDRQHNDIMRKLGIEQEEDKKTMTQEEWDHKWLSLPIVPKFPPEEKTT